VRGVLLLIVVLVGFSAACAPGRTVMDVTRPVILPAAGQARAFRIVKVVDDRVFETHPRSHDIPTLNDEAIHDASITSRAFARSRGVAGQTRGDFLLPEGTSVADLARDCVTSAVSRAGGVVVEANDPRAASAIPLTVHVERLWSFQSATYFHHRNNTILMQFDAALRVRAPLPGFEQGLFVEAKTSERAHTGTADSFEHITEQGLMKLTQALVKQLEPSIAKSTVATTAGGEAFTL
jgi:hypothetical protein